MSQNNNKEKNTVTKTVPRQKIVTAGTPEELDKKANEWLEMMALEKNILPVHGKSWHFPDSYGNNGVTLCATYYYLENKQIESNEKK